MLNTEAVSIAAGGSKLENCQPPLLNGRPMILCMWQKIANHAMDELHYAPATELASKIRRGEISPVELVDTYLDRIEDRNERLNAYVTLLDENARERAHKAEREIQTGNLWGPLHGIPIAIKDLFAFKKGVRNTFGSQLFLDFVPEEDAILVERLEQAGAIVLGKTNTPEFGHKGTTDNLVFGSTGTPFAPDKTAGGSSGGSAAAVADGLAALGQGSDAGGSVRIPGSACGVYAFHPSFGRVPVKFRPDAFAAHTPFIQSGVITRTVEDAAVMFDVIAGHHPRDPFSIPDEGADYVAATKKPIDNFDIAYSPNLDVFPIDERVKRVVEDAIGTFDAMGTNIEEANPTFNHSREEMLASWKTGFQTLFAAIAENFKEGFDIDLLSQRDNVTPAVIETIEAGQDISAVEYKRADVVRTSVFDAVQDTFAEYDLLLTPTLAIPPFDKEDHGPTEINGEKIDPLYGWFLTWPFNMTGHPAASIPAGFTDEGLPIGLQIVGQHHAEETIFAASAAFERAKPWYDAYPT